MQQRRLDESGIRRAEARTFPTGHNLGQPLLLLQLELLAALLVLEALQPLALGVVLHARLHLLQLELLLPLHLRFELLALTDYYRFHCAVTIGVIVVRRRQLQLLALTEGATDRSLLRTRCKQRRVTADNATGSR